MSYNFKYIRILNFVMLIKGYLIIKGLRNNPRGLSPGREGHAQQVTFNHYPATACKINYAGGKKTQNKNLRLGRWN